MTDKYYDTNCRFIKEMQKYHVNLSVLAVLEIRKLSKFLSQGFFISPIMI